MIITIRLRTFSAIYLADVETEGLKNVSIRLRNAKHQVQALLYQLTDIS